MLVVVESQRLLYPESIQIPPVLNSLYLRVPKEEGWAPEKVTIRSELGVFLMRRKRPPPEAICQYLKDS